MTSSESILVYSLGSSDLFSYDEKIEDPGETLYFGCVLLCDLPDAADGLTAGLRHRAHNCRQGNEIGRILETGARLKGFDDNNVQQMDLYITDEYI
jgi:hypothetical protein